MNDFTFFSKLFQGVKCSSPLFVSISPPDVVINPGNSRLIIMSLEKHLVTLSKLWGEIGPAYINVLKKL